MYSHALVLILLLKWSYIYVLLELLTYIFVVFKLIVLPLFLHQCVSQLVEWAYHLGHALSLIDKIEVKEKGILMLWAPPTKKLTKIKFPQKKGVEKMRVKVEGWIGSKGCPEIKEQWGWILSSLPYYQKPKNLFIYFFF